MGDIGFPGMNLVCQNKFGDLARIATSVEYVSSPAAEDAPTAVGAWIQPVVVAALADGRLLDFSGVLVNDASDLNCDAFGVADTKRGMTVSEAGSMRFLNCNVDRRVACSAP